MKKIIWILLSLPLSAFSYTLTPEILKTSLAVYKTPNQIIGLAEKVFPTDAQDLKDFFQKNQVALDKPMPTIEVESYKVIVPGLSEALTLNTDGSFSYKSQKFSYDTTQSFKKNLELFNKSFGTYREFKSQARHSVWLNEALAGDTSAWVTFFPRAFAMAESADAFNLPNEVHDRGHYKKEAPQIKECNPPTMNFDHYWLRIESRNDKSATFKLSDNNVPLKQPNPIYKVTFDKDHKTISNLQIQGDILAGVNKGKTQSLIQALLWACMHHDEKQYNEQQNKLANYLDEEEQHSPSNKLAPPAYDSQESNAK